MNRLAKECLSLKRHEREELIAILKKSTECEESELNFQRKHSAIVKVMGCEVITSDRKRNAVIGRTILAFSLSLDGWKEHQIAERLHKDHSMVNIMKKNMREWLTEPRFYKTENELYVEFLKELNNETDR